MRTRFWHAERGRYGKPFERQQRRIGRRMPGLATAFTTRGFLGGLGPACIERVAGGRHRRVGTVATATFALLSELLLEMADASA